MLLPAREHEGEPGIRSAELLSYLKKMDMHISGRHLHSTTLLLYIVLV